MIETTKDDGDFAIEIVMILFVKENNSGQCEKHTQYELYLRSITNAHVENSTKSTGNSSKPMGDAHVTMGLPCR